MGLDDEQSAQLKNLLNDPKSQVFNYMELQTMITRFNSTVIFEQSSTNNFNISEFKPVFKNFGLNPYKDFENLSLTNQTSDILAQEIQK